MSEYVFEIDESRADVMGSMPCERREEVVRCRDCVHAHERAKYCDRFSSCGLTDFVDVEPYGFCAWGKRREES